MRIAKLTRAEFDDAIGNLLEYKTVGFKFQEGKNDKARGAKKKLFFCFSSGAEPPKPPAEDEDDDPPDRYYGDDDDFGPVGPLDDSLDDDDDDLFPVTVSAATYPGVL